MLVMTDEQVYVVFLGHLPESGSLEYGGPSAVEAAHHDLLSQVLDDGRYILCLASLAVYKVCHSGGCRDADILVAFDNAITGVDVISFSIGNAVPLQYFEDAGAIGSFHAVRRGVLTSATNNNSELDGGHACNIAPWMLSFAASSIHSRFVDKIVLGNGKTIVGTSIRSFSITCEPDGLAGGSYEGKIVLCPADNSGDPNDGAGPFMAGADGAVIVGHYPNLSQAPDLAAPGVGHYRLMDAAVITNRPESLSTTGRSSATSSLQKEPTISQQYDVDAATPMNTPGNAGSNELKYGAGQLNPSKAPDPGLVYDARSDYVAMLCAQG
ncbi:cucumisin-like [Setaria viridis]|uniref:cucumisin-like n=1 Tax=Setaria viridis TaxID=4556 RepID=UPI003B3A3BE6